MQKKIYNVLILHTTLDVVSGKGKYKSYRDIAVLDNQSLSTLARAIVNAFEFDFDHCYGFYDNLNDMFHSNEVYELFTDIGEEPTPGAFGVEHVKIVKAFPTVGKTMRFLFDYGDGWQFTVTLQKIKPVKDKKKYPRVVAQFGDAPEQYPELEEESGEEEFCFDDCVICQGMKKAEENGKNLTPEELKMLFEKQNKQN